MSKELSVSAIENGTVIDHIHVGHAMRIVRLLHLAEHKKRVTLGLNLSSRSMQYKDIIKVEGKEISEEEANSIAVFAPKATINIIRNYVVIRKFHVELPPTIDKVIKCPNLHCVTNHENMTTSFFLKHFGEHVELECKYCQKGFSHDSY